MAFSVPNDSEVRMLEYILNKTSPQDLDIRLFSNNHVPSETDTVANYTEVAGGGYNLIQLVPVSWSISAADPSIATHTQVSWTFTGAVGDIYGYYVTRRTSGDLMWAEQFNNGPYTINSNGDEIRITPRLSLS